MSNQLELLKERQNGYKPSNEILEGLAARRIDLGIVLGPLGVGKSAAIRRAIMLDHELGRVRSLTTRERRKGEKRFEYDFLPHNDKTLRQLGSHVVAGQVVQYRVAEFNDRVYASYLRRYHKQKLIIDVMHSALPDFDNLPFETVTAMVLVSEPSAWTHNASKRLRQHTKKEVRGRIKEGISTLELALEADEAFTWLKAGIGRQATERVAHNIVALMNGEDIQTQGNRAVGERLLSHLYGLI